MLVLGRQVWYEKILVRLVLIQQEWNTILRLDVRGGVVVVLLGAAL